MPRTRFLGTGYAVPDRVVTNDDLSRMMDTSDEWIRTRTGIRERRWVREGETGVDLALAATHRAACLRAIQRFQIKEADRGELEVRRAKGDLPAGHLS